MSRKNPNKKTLDFTKSGHVDVALNMLMSSSDNEASEDSFDYDNDWTEDTWMNAKLDQIQNTNTTDDDILFSDLPNNSYHYGAPDTLPANELLLVSITCPNT